MRFLVDGQLPATLARWLIEHGHDAEHLLDIGLAQSKDNPIWLYADKMKAVIVTKDEDFSQWIIRGRPGPSVVWLRVGNISNRALLAWLEPLLPLVVSQLEKGERLIEVA